MRKLCVLLWIPAVAYSCLKSLSLSVEYWIALLLVPVNSSSRVFSVYYRLQVNVNLTLVWMVWCLQVSGATKRLPQHTLSTFNFRSLPRAADADQLHHNHHYRHHGHHCRPSQPASAGQRTCLPVTTSVHGLRCQQPYCSDVTSTTASAQVCITGNTV